MFTAELAGRTTYLALEKLDEVCGFSETYPVAD